MNVKVYDTDAELRRDFRRCVLSVAAALAIGLGYIAGFALGLW